MPKCKKLLEKVMVDLTGEDDEDQESISVDE